MNSKDSDAKASGTPGGAENGSAYPEPVERLLEQLERLPGIGRRSAERLAFHVLTSQREEALRLSQAIRDVKERVRHCRVCFNFSQGGTCSICSDPRRDRSLVLVVEQPRDALVIEKTGMYRGVYHVLMGRLSPLDGVGPGELTIAALFDRVDEPEKNCGGEQVREVVLGLNPNMEGDGTALYLTEHLRRRGVVISRLARGLPAGSQLEYANKAVLADAIEGRRPLDS